MPVTDSQINAVLNRELTKLTRQLANVEATKAMIAILEAELKTATTKK